VRGASGGAGSCEARASARRSRRPRIVNGRQFSLIVSAGGNCQWPPSRDRPEPQELEVRADEIGRLRCRASGSGRAAYSRCVQRSDSALGARRPVPDADARDACSDASDSNRLRRGVVAVSERLVVRPSHEQRLPNALMSTGASRVIPWSLLTWAENYPARTATAARPPCRRLRGPRGSRARRRAATESTGQRGRLSRAAARSRGDVDDANHREVRAWPGGSAQDRDARCRPAGRDPLAS
jgi:hypothetical protein